MKNEHIFITGGTGYLGKELIKKLLPYNTITVFSRNRTKQNQLKKDKGIRILRDYQVQGVKALQLAYCKENKRRFL